MTTEVSGPNAARPEWITAERFEVRVDGMSAAAFSSCTGLGGAARFVTLREGGSDAPRLFRDEMRWDPVRLERGYLRDESIWEWFDSGEPRDGEILLLGPDGSVEGRWSFHRGRVARWKAPEMDASLAVLAVERVELVHEGLRWENP